MIGLFGDVFWKEIISIIFSAKHGRVFMAVVYSTEPLLTKILKKSTKVPKKVQKKLNPRIFHVANNIYLFFCCCQLIPRPSEGVGLEKYWK